MPKAVKLGFELGALRCPHFSLRIMMMARRGAEKVAFTGTAGPWETGLKGKVQANKPLPTAGASPHPAPLHLSPFCLTLSGPGTAWFRLPQHPVHLGT